MKLSIGRRVQTKPEITAVGSDTPHKQELDSAILARADVIVADSIAQCLERGEIHKATESGHIGKARLSELGDVIAGKNPGRASDDQVTVADLTGVAVQDIAIATALSNKLITAVSDRNRCARSAALTARSLPSSRFRLRTDSGRVGSTSS